MCIGHLMHDYGGTDLPQVEGHERILHRKGGLNGCVS